MLMSFHKFFFVIN